MSTLSTPSAKAHERVTGRWLRDIQVSDRKDWMVYYAKSVIGTPIPWLFVAIAIVSAFSRAGSEIASWTTAILTILYIAADRFARTREFSFFRIGADFFLLGLALVGLVGALTSSSISLGVATIGDLRWIVLLYAFTYCWELFPGLNRVFTLLVAAGCVVAAYGLWQHFMGLDLLTGETLPDAPVARHPFFVPTGFFGTPEAFGTLLVTLLPFPAAAFFQSEDRDHWIEKWLPLGIVVLFTIAIMWTYRPGFWMAAAVGVVVTMIMQAKKLGTFIIAVAITVAAVTFASYDSPSSMLDGVQASEQVRADRQRAQINTQVDLWQKSIVFGAGHESTEAGTYDAGTGNVYFHILAETGVLGAALYLLFILSFLLGTYRIYQEIPSTHTWHRVMIAGGLGSQIAFHAAGLYWVTFAEALTMNLFILILSAMSYISEHYSRGLVSDDVSL
ncbi:MAG: O-antigen ligase family protein [Bdellovibrionota bacterium]